MSDNHVPGREQEVKDRLAILSHRMDEPVIDFMQIGLASDLPVYREWRQVHYREWRQVYDLTSAMFSLERREP